MNPLQAGDSPDLNLFHIIGLMEKRLLWPVMNIRLFGEKSEGNADQKDFKDGYLGIAAKNCIDDASADYGRHTEENKDT